MIFTVTGMKGIIHIVESPSTIPTKVTRSKKDPYQQPLEAIKFSLPIFINSPLHYHKIKDVTAEL